MDDFTRRHLAAWVDQAVWPDERESFVAWVEALDDDDREYLIDKGWPATYAAYHRAKEQTQ